MKKKGEGGNPDTDLAAIMAACRSMSRNLKAYTVLIALLSASALAVGHDSLMEPTAGATFRAFDNPNGPTPQEQVTAAHRTRAVPVAFVIALLVSGGGGLWIAKTGRHWVLWLAIVLLAGAASFAGAAPFVPLTGRTAGPNYTGRVASLEFIADSAAVGIVLGCVIGSVAALAWAALVGRCVCVTRN